MKRDAQKTNRIVDAALLGGFLGSLWLDLTGVPAHQWLGLAVGAVTGYHLVAHWKWVKAVSGRFFGRTSSQSRAYYLVDVGLAAGVTAILGTGLVISTWLDLSLAGYAAWHTVHVAASVGTLALLVAKIGLHWRWIAGVARRSIFSAPAPVRQVGALQRASVAVRIDRRDFMRLMAGAGAVAVLAGANALGSLAEARAVRIWGTAGSTRTATTMAAVIWGVLDVIREQGTGVGNQGGAAGADGRRGHPPCRAWASDRADWMPGYALFGQRVVHITHT